MTRLPKSDLWEDGCLAVLFVASLFAIGFGVEVLNRFIRYEQASGEELRHTFGARLEAKRGGWEIAYEASGQFGTLENYDILAYGAATFTGYRWDQL